MVAQRVVFIQFRVIKIIPRIMQELQTLHESPGPLVAGCRKGNKLFKIENIKSICGRLTGCPKGDSLPPVLPTQPPADFDTRREMSHKLGYRQPGKPGKVSRHLHRPQSPSIILDALLKTLKGRPGLIPRQRPWKIAHDIRVCIHGGKRFKIAFMPLTEYKRGLQGTIRLG